MLDYHEYENRVFEWLKAKHESDPMFTFSLRQKGTKAARTDRFIGTKKGGYFGTTFWTIPVAYPGASADFIDLFFIQNKHGYDYFLNFSKRIILTLGKTHWYLIYINPFTKNFLKNSKLMPTVGRGKK